LGVAWRYITQDTGWLWYTAVAGVACLFLVRWTSQSRIFLSVWLLASACSIAPGLHFRPHYFILLMPIAGLFVGVALASIDRFAALRIGAMRVRVAVILAFAGIGGLYVGPHAHYLFRMDETELIRAQYADHPFLEAPGIARYLNAHTSPDDRIAVLGSEPEIYFYAQRKSATGIYTYALLESQPYAARMQDR
jgi:hypothetical protein